MSYVRLVPRIVIDWDVTSLHGFSRVRTMRKRLDTKIRGRGVLDTIQQSECGDGKAGLCPWNE